MKSTIDWDAIAAQLLDREPRPSLLLDAKGRVVWGNQALHRLMGEGRCVRGLDFKRECLAAQHGERFDEALKLAKAGQRPRVGLTVPPISEDLVAVFEVSGLVARRGVRAVLLTLVDFTGLTVPPVPAAGLHYEVIADAAEAPRVVRVAGGGRSFVAGDDRPCFAVLHGAEQMCADCPLRSALAGPHASVRLVSAAPFRAELVWATPRVSGAVAISMMPVSEGQYGQLVKARVAALAERAGLTPRQRRVLDLLVLGRSNEDIAGVEGVTPRTAKYHQQQVLRRLGAESRVDLLRLLT